jgi:transposase
MSQSGTRFLGMEVHNESIAVASVAPEHGAEVPCLGSLGTRQCDSDPRIRKRPSQATSLVCVYAAGLCGSWLSRSLTTQGSPCGVVAPSLLPTQAGDRVQTDRRDAGPLARLMRAGARTPVSVPTVAEEALRDLRRARAETLGARKAATLRRTACLLRHDIRSTGRATWHPAHLRWLSEVVCPTPAQQLVFQADVRAVTEPPARLQRLAQARPEQVNAWRLPPGVDALQALRGVQLTVALPTVAARGDLPRFDTPRELLQCLGLPPAESATGERRRQGALTTAGHTHARRALVAGAWASRDPATVRRHLQRRRDKHPQAIQDIRWTAQGRLGKRSRRLRARGTHATQVVGAMARALVGFLWALATQVPVPPSPYRPMEANTPPHCEGCHRASAEAPPRCGVILDGVQRLQETLGPSVRQAPDGGKAGGHHPTESSRSTRRFFLAPALPRPQG